MMYALFRVPNMMYESKRGTEYSVYIIFDRVTVNAEKGWWEGDDGPEEEYDGSISWKLNVFKLIQLLPFVATAIWIIVEIL